MGKSKEILIIGIGNPLRSDDGIGAYVCNAIDAMAIQGVTTQTVQQLHVEMATELLAFDVIIFVDAAVDIPEVRLYKIDSTSSHPASTSHHVNASMVVALTQKLYNQPIEGLICAVPGENFDIGNQLSTEAKDNAHEAILSLRKWINNVNV